LKTLTISLYNRLQYTERLFQYLDECYGIQDYEINICCEPGHKPIEDLARNFRPSQTHVTVNPRRYGCNTNIFQCLAIGFSKNDYHIHFEDDTIPGKDCLKYFEWARERYKDDKTIFTISGYVNSDNKTEHYYPPSDDISLVERRSWFTPWGWATWKDRFKDMENVWDFAGARGSWDATVNHVARNGRGEIFPAVSRVQNIGADLGTHVPSAEWHKNNHFNNYWIESINKYNNNFKENV